MLKDLTQYKNFSKLFNVVHNLKNSQGFYNRLYNNLVNLTEIEMLGIEKQLPDFSDEVDIILFLEN